MNNPLKVSLDNIIPLTEARDHFSQIVSEVQKDKLYILTKGGKPAVAIIDVKYLEQLTGGEVNEEHVEKDIRQLEEKVPEEVDLPPIVEHTPPPPPPIMPPEPKSVTPPSPPPPAPSIAPPAMTPAQPLQTPPVEPQKQEINVQMTPDGDSTQKNAALENSFAVPEDKPLPGQYDGKTDDMPID